MSTCTLCDLPTPDPPVTAGSVDGRFCCRGCLEVARTLDDPGETDPEQARDAVAGDGSRVDDADGEETFFAVEGMHCATCEAFVEGRATDDEGVLAAEASYPSDMVRVVYDPDTVAEDDLFDLLSGTGYRARPVEEDTRTETELSGRLLVGGFFGMMVMLWYVLFLYPAYFGVDSETLLLDVHGAAGAYLLGNAAVMSGVVLFYTGYPILRGAYVSLRAGQPNMDLLVALAATTAYVFSVATLLTGGVEVYFDISVVVVMAVTLGGYYETRVKERAAGHLTDLTEQRVGEARRRTPDGTEKVAVDDLSPGDELLVRPGERVPVDGHVVEGTAALDRSLVTGESVPERRSEGDEVVGGALVTDGALVVAAEGTESTLDRLLSRLWTIQSSRPGVQRLADRLATVFVPLVVVLALLAVAVHLALGATPTGALLTGLAVLVVSCPCALGLATPLAVASGVRSALNRGIVVTDGSVFETATETDVVAFDKTGTLTTGRMRVVETVRHDNGIAGDGGHAVTAPDPLARASAVEQFSDHPLADAVTDHTAPPDLPVTDFERHPGRGVSATVDGERVVVGTRELLAAEGLSIPATLRADYERAGDAGRVPALVGWDGRARALVVAADEPRPEWERVVSDLATERDVVVITGDDERAAERFRNHDAVSEVFAGVPPEAKAEVVQRLRGEGTVAMVGDGSNDAPALAAADIGIALESGTRLAADAADVVVTTDDLATVPSVFSITRAARRRIRQNLGWAFCYNAVALPLTMAGLINPLLAAVAMASSSLLVVGNSARSCGDAATERDNQDGQPVTTD
ncbi:heavy metal translocating P-type ATPase [Halorientalis litorea]|uniref:heavy metal translocating P-type ATPase n=1 Tax=Halorientalis litorea TaxID=2931977 RepID=UPI001FF672D1|nr:heavy metal translocating P-type ATPase [Halorientalis litorea]